MSQNALGPQQAPMGYPISMIPGQGPGHGIPLIGAPGPYPAYQYPPTPYLYDMPPQGPMTGMPPAQNGFMSPQIQIHSQMEKMAPAATSNTPSNASHN